MDRRKVLKTVASGVAIGSLMIGNVTANEGGRKALNDAIEEDKQTHGGPIHQKYLDHTVSTDSVVARYEFEYKDGYTTRLVETIFPEKGWEWAEYDGNKFKLKLNESSEETETKPITPGSDQMSTDAVTPINGGGDGDGVNDVFAGTDTTFSAGTGSDKWYGGASAGGHWARAKTANFEVQAGTSATFAGSINCGAQVWTDFKVANDSDPETTMHITVPYEYQGNIAAANGEGSLIVGAALWNMHTGESVYINELKDVKRQYYVNSYDDSGTITWDKEASPGTTYRILVQVSAGSFAFGYASASVDFYDSSSGDRDYASLGEISLEWM